MKDILVGITPDSANSLKEAIERRGYEDHMRKRFLERKLGSKSAGEAVFEAEKQGKIKVRR